MPMATDPLRRRLLAALPPALCAPADTAAPQTPARLAATWASGVDGSYHAGLSLQNKEHLPKHGHGLEAKNTIELPTRAHALLAGPDGALLVVARRPGDWLLRWRPGAAAEPQWAWAAPERAFNGHALWSADGTRLFTTETDLGSGAGLVGVRDARTLDLLAEWPTHGIDPHELLLDAGGQLIVANGGVPTRPETGRAKGDLGGMDSSLVRLHAATGRRLGQWRLPDPRLSLRHLARTEVDGQPHIGIALQAEHGDAAARAAAPVLALFDGEGLRSVASPEPLAGYGGSIAACAGALWVSCPRVNGVARFDARGRWQGLVPLPEACALAPDSQGRRLWIGGLECAARHDGARPAAFRATGLRLDNHWLWWPHGPAGARFRASLKMKTIPI